VQALYLYSALVTLVSTFVKGTAARDFFTSVFFINQTHLGPFIARRLYLFSRLLVMPSTTLSLTLTRYQTGRGEGALLQVAEKHH
jgi:hypothetical protein